MAKKLTNNVLSDQPQTVGLDIGFGFTKAVTESQEIMFPSVAAHARQSFPSRPCVRHAHHRRHGVQVKAQIRVNRAIATAVRL